MSARVAPSRLVPTKPSPRPWQLPLCNRLTETQHNFIAHTPAASAASPRISTPSRPRCSLRHPSPRLPLRPSWLPRPLPRCRQPSSTHLPDLAGASLSAARSPKAPPPPRGLTLLRRRPPRPHSPSQQQPPRPLQLGFSTFRKHFRHSGKERSHFRSAHAPPPARLASGSLGSARASSAEALRWSWRGSSLAGTGGASHFCGLLRGGFFHGCSPEVRRPLSRLLPGLA